MNEMTLRRSWGRNSKRVYFVATRMREMGIWKLRGLRRVIERAICPLRRESEN